MDPRSHLINWFGKSSGSGSKTQPPRGDNLNRMIFKSLNHSNRHIKKMADLQFLDSVVENLPDMIFVKEAKTLTFVKLNRAGEQILEFQREELIGKSDYDFFPREQADFFVQQDRAVLASGRMLEISKEPIRKKSGGTCFLRTKKIPIFDRWGRPIYLLGISADITLELELEKQRQSLQQKEIARVEAERLARRLSFLSEVSAVLNSSLDCKKTLQILGELIVNNIADCCVIDCLDDSDKPTHLVATHKDPEKLKLIWAIRAKYPRNWDLNLGPSNVMRTGISELYTCAGDYLHKVAQPGTDHLDMLKRLGVESCMVVPIKTHSKIMGTITMTSSTPLFTDIDLSLANEVAKRASLAIENAQLFEKAQDSNQAKSIFLANMSHEIRTPLGAMLGFAELLAEGPNLSQDQSQLVQTIVRSGRQLFQIVDEILDLSKIEANKVNLEMIRFSLADVIQDVTALLTLKASEKNLELRVCSLNQVPEYVISDPTRTRQIFFAIKFTQSGKVEVSLRTLPIEGELDCFFLETTVSDSGTGISVEQAERLFQPFNQADNTVVRKFGGTGLGLCLSRKFARALGGDVYLKESTPGKGSTFVFTQKLRVAESVVREPVSACGTGDAAILSLKVLVVDDSQDNRFLLSTYVKRSGGFVECACNGREAVEKAIMGDYDVVLMDLQMPELDGVSAMQLLRERNYHKPIVAVTAHAMKGDREQCLAQGFDSYLSKPISKTKLLEVLSQFLEWKMSPRVTIPETGASKYSIPVGRQINFGESTMMGEPKSIDTN